MKLSGLRNACEVLTNAIPKWRGVIDATICFAPEYITKRSAGRSSTYLNLLISVVGKGSIYSSYVEFTDPKDIQRLADQLINNVQNLRRIAAELEAIQDKEKK